MTQSSDSIIENKLCRISGKEFSITQGDFDFYEKISPTFAGQKFIIPTPTLCPEERQKRRMSFRNERNLYRRTCDASGKQIISMYRPDNGYKIYDQKIRWSDSRNPMDYGFEFDFSKTFTENFRDLILNIPLPSLLNLNAENSEYCNRSNQNKNCYLTFMNSYSEDCSYGTFIQFSKDCIDCLNIIECQNCYECTDSQNCHTVFYSSNSSDCSFSSYLQYCHGCSFCYGCNNLANQQYCIFNIKYTKEEYFEKIKLIALKEVESFKSKVILESTIINSPNSTGSHLKNCKNCFECFNGFEGENLKYILNFGYLKDSYDCTAFGHQCALNIENIAGEEDYHVGFTFATLSAQYVWYSMFCSQGVSNVFGSLGLRNKQYCIFNKQYTKEEYELTTSKIISHMMTTGERGEFFHPSLSPFGYNETVAQEYFPEQQGKLEKFGYKRSTYESPKAVSDKIIQGKDLPSTIEETSDDLLQYAIACEVTGKLFRIQPQELAFYRKHNIPLPRKHPDQRHLERLALRK